MIRLPMTAADKDALIAAAAVGLTITRTSKDFFLEDGDDKARVTPGEIKRLIAEAQLRAAHQADERAETLALADEIREQEAGSQVAAVEEESAEPVAEAPAAEPEQVEPQPVAQPTPSPSSPRPPPRRPPRSS